MAFDRESTADLTALRQEVINDPASVGYVVSGPTDGLLDKLNNSAENPGNETGSPQITPRLIPENLVFSDFTGMNEGNRAFIEILLNKDLEADLESFRSRLVNAFGGGSAATVQAIAGLTKDLSRAEVLFGIDTIIDREDLVAARDL